MLFFFISRVFQQICNHFTELRSILGSSDRNAGLRLNGLSRIASHLASSTGHVYWILHMLSHLKAADGVAGFLLANGALGDSDTLEIRKKLIQNDKVEAIVILPRELFITTDISVTLWILNQNKKGGKYHERMLRNREHEILFAKIACVQRKDTAYFLFSFNSTRFRAILLPKYNCVVSVEEKYHTKHGQAALHRHFNFDSPVTQ